MDGRSISIGQVCRDKLVLAEPCDLQPTAARLIITVGGEDKVYDNFLPHGVSHNTEAVKFF